ncbi:MAG TPA: hypothetical protein DFS52_12455 [Myxococcales bacterium]|nr:hypothetical protein [Myxococcales bacterium]
MDLFSKRLPHVVTRGDLVVLLSPTYAGALRVDEEVAAERIERALAASPELLAALYSGLSDALRERQGPRTSEDALVDKLSAGIGARRHRVKPAQVSAAVSAALVWMDLEAGVAPEMMRNALETPKGRALLGDGLREIGRHLVKELVR